MAIFPDEPILLKIRTVEVVVATGAIRLAKLQSNHHTSNKPTSSFYGLDALPVPNHQCQSTEWRPTLMMTNDD